MLTPANKQKAQDALCGLITNFAHLVDALDPTLRAAAITWGMSFVEWLDKQGPSNPCPPPAAPAKKP